MKKNEAFYRREWHSLSPKDVKTLNLIYKQVDLVGPVPERPRNRCRMWVRPLAFCILFWALFFTVSSVGSVNKGDPSPPCTVNLATHTYNTSIQAHLVGPSRFSLFSSALRWVGLETLFQQSSNDLLSESLYKCSQLAGDRVTVLLGVPANITAITVIGIQEGIRFLALPFVQDKGRISYISAIHGFTQTVASQSTGVPIEHGPVSLNGPRQGVEIHFIDNLENICLHQICIYGIPLTVNLY